MRAMVEETQRRASALLSNSTKIENAHNDWVYDGKFIDQNTILSCSKGGSLRLYDLQARRTLSLFDQSNESFNRLEYCAERQCAFSSTITGKVLFADLRNPWEEQDGARTETYQTNESLINGICLDRRTRASLHTSCLDGVASEIDLETKKLRRQMQVGFCLAQVDHDAETGLLAFSGACNQISVYDGRARTLVRRLAREPTLVQDYFIVKLAFARLQRLGAVLVASDTLRTISFWDVVNNKIVQTTK